MHLEKSFKMQLGLRHILFIVITFALAFISSVLVYASQVKEVKVDNKGKDIIVKTMGRTVGDVIKEAGIKLDSDDIVSPQLDCVLKPVCSIEIKDGAQQAAPLENPNGIGRVENIVNPDSTVVDENGSLNSLSAIGSNSSEKIITVKDIVPFDVEKNPNNQMKKGETKVVREGKEGLAEKSYVVTYHDGVEVSRKYLDQKIITKPVNKVVEYGTATVLTTSRGDTLRYRKSIEMTATAYDSSYESTGKSPGHPYYGITASGMAAKRGVVAVDPAVIPLGTRLYIESMQNGVPSYGYAVAADTGGAIKGNKIDLFFETRQEVADWGVRKVRVYILE